MERTRGEAWVSPRRQSFNTPRGDSGARAELSALSPTAYCHAAPQRSPMEERATLK